MLKICLILVIARLNLCSLYGVLSQGSLRNLFPIFYRVRKIEYFKVKRNENIYKTDPVSK